MAGLVFFLFISMFFIGLVQILTGLGILITTKNEVVRKHLIFYLGGVAAYFLGLSAFHDVDHYSEFPLYIVVFFFSGALSLGIYHLVIMVAPDRLS